MLAPLLLSCLLGLAAAGPMGFPPAFTSCPGGYKDGEKIREGQFVKQCTVSDTSYSIAVIGCLTAKGTEILIGTTKEENKLVFKCIATEGGGARIETLPAGSSGSSGSSATKAPTGPKENLKCEEDGKKYTNGEKFNKGMFVKQCVSSPSGYSIDLVACLSPAGKEIAIGGKLEEARVLYKCVKTGNGAKLETEAASGPKTPLKCKDKYSNGQKFPENSFVKQCNSSASGWAINIIACLTPKGKEIAIGTKTEEGKLIYSCVATKEGAQLETDLATKGCDDGKYKKDQTYYSPNNRFLLKCLDNYGSNDIIACITEDKKEVKVGAELIAGDFKYKCVREKNGSVKYMKEPIVKPTKPKGCGKYAVGEHILSEDGKFKFTCTAPNQVDFTACIVEGGEVKAETKTTLGEWIYDCKSAPGGKGGATLSKKRIV